MNRHCHVLALSPMKSTSDGRKDEINHRDIVTIGKLADVLMTNKQTINRHCHVSALTQMKPTSDGRKDEINHRDMVTIGKQAEV